jgi:hypothetical protein
MAKERITNPDTHRDYRIQQRTTNRRRKGQIAGLWHKKE